MPPVKDPPKGSTVPTPPPIPSYSRGRVSAMGVLAEIETIEPILRRHQQETQAQLAQSLNPQVRQILPALGIKSTNEEQFLKIVDEISQETARQTVEEAAKIQVSADTTVTVADSLVETIATHPEIGPQFEDKKEEIFKKVVPEVLEAVQKNQQNLEKVAVLANMDQIAKLNTNNPTVQELLSTTVEQTIEDQAPLLEPNSREVLKANLKSTYLTTYQENLLKNLQLTDNSIPTLAQLQQMKEQAHTAATAAADKTFLQTPNAKQITTRVPTNLLAANLAQALNLKPPRLTQIKSGLMTQLVTSSPRRYQELYLTALSHDQETLAKALKENSQIIEELKGKKALSHKDKKTLEKAQKNYARYTNAQSFKVKQPKKYTRNIKFFSTIFDGRPELASLHIWQSEYFVQKHMPNVFLANQQTTAGVVLSKSGFKIPGFSLSSLFSSMKGATSASQALGMGMAPAKAINSLRNKVTAIIGAPIGALMLYLMSLGKAAVAGAIVGMAAGGIAGAVIPVALLGPAGALLWPVTIPLGIVMGGTAGALISLGLASGSATMISMGAASATGALIGGYIGFGVGATAGIALAAACIAFTAGLCTPFAPFIVAGSTAIGTAIGAALGFVVGLGVGYVIGNYLIDPTISAIKSFAGSASSGFGIGGFLSSAGNFLVGLAQTAIGAVGTAIGGTFGVLSGAANLLVSGVTAISIPGSAVLLLTAGPVGAVGVLATFGAISTAASFATIDTDNPSGIQTPGQNEYFTLTKTAAPDRIENSSLPTNISYTIKLEAKENLANIQITDVVKVQQKDTSTDIPLGVNSCTDPPPTQILSGESWSCNLTITAQNSYTDSFVANALTVKATPEGQAEVVDSTTATTTIGNPPTVCAILNLQGGWSSAERTNINTTCQSLDKSARQVSLLQNAGTIALVKVPRDSLGAGVCGTVFGGNQIKIACDFNTLSFTKYVLIHELGHVIGNYNASVYQAFRNSGAFEKEGLMPTYPFNVSNEAFTGPNESFAEMNTEYTTSKEYSLLPRPWSSYPGGPWTNPGPGWTTFPNDRPQHYNFAKAQLFGGVEY